MAIAAQSDPEIAVVRAVSEGDADAFSDLMRRNHRWVRGVVFGVLGDHDMVDDVAQQVWTTVWRGIGGLRQHHRWRPWLYRLAKNTAVSAGREISRQRAVLTHVPSGPVVETRSPTPAQALTNREASEVVMEAIRGLPARYREPFVLRHLQGWSYRQIAETMGLPVDTVETRLVRARRLLRKALDGKV
jgi:RNA polymerase sigma-70 factor (ECF subfamily)